MLTKNKGGRRPSAWAARVPPDGWQALDAHRQIAITPQPLVYCKPTQQHVLRWTTETGLIKHAIVLSSILDWSVQTLMQEYDDRALCEKEIQADKSGLALEHRRKKRLAAQEMVILLTDVAHNLLAWTSRWMFSSGPLAGFGPLRLTQDVLAQPGRLRFAGQQLCEVQLNIRHPHAQATAEALTRLFDHFGHP